MQRAGQAHAEGPGFISQRAHASVCSHGSFTVSLPLPGVSTQATPPIRGRVRDIARACVRVCVRGLERGAGECEKDQEFARACVCVGVSVCSINAPRSVASGLSALITPDLSRPPIARVCSHILTMRNRVAHHHLSFLREVWRPRCHMWARPRQCSGPGARAPAATSKTRLFGQKVNNNRGYHYLKVICLLPVCCLKSPHRVY